MHARVYECARAPNKRSLPTKVTISAYAFLSKEITNDIAASLGIILMELVTQKLKPTRAIITILMHLLEMARYIACI